LNRRTAKDERGQVLSSLVAVLAVVAIVGGLLVLFGTRGNDSVADAKPAGQTSATPKPSVKPSATPTATPTPAEPTPPPVSEPVETPSVQPPPEETPVAPPTSKPVIPPSERPAVEVYNNSSRKGLAEDVAIRARQAGWTVAGRDNWHGKIVTSTVYYPPGMLAEANQLAKDIGVGSTKNALPNMKMDRLSVILTTDHAG
jgi:pyruvate/2-oxoglutarate dehydrogenase complex dihydrolipoamide acyltransferase (E2) component